MNTPYVKRYSAETGELLNPISSLYLSRVAYRNAHGEVVALPNRRERRAAGKAPQNHFMQEVPYFVDSEGKKINFNDGVMMPSLISDGKITIKTKTVWHHTGTARWSKLSRQPKSAKSKRIKRTLANQ